MTMPDPEFEKEINQLNQHTPAYVNRFRIAHSPLDFILDFECSTPGDPTPQVISRLVTSPQGVKLLLNVLTDNIARYEAAYGEIRLPGTSNLADHLFHPNPNKPDSP